MQNILSVKKMILDILVYVILFFFPQLHKKGKICFTFAFSLWRTVLVKLLKIVFSY